MRSKVFISDSFRPFVCLLVLVSIGVNRALAQDIERSSYMQSLIPSVAVVQYAGNIGEVSLGVGCEYGKNDRWSTQLLLGYLPKEVMFDDYFCLTLRQQFHPWNVDFGEDYSFRPASFSISANTLFSGSFWYREPVSGYYKFSSKLRFHIGLGSRFDIKFPFAHESVKSRKESQRLSFYYEFSTYDLAVISYFGDKAIHLSDILCLGFGLQYRFF